MFRPRSYQAYSDHQRCGIVSKYGTSSGWVLYALYYPYASIAGIHLYSEA
jgi:hypothetical protein